MEYRIERDSMGEIKVLADKLWGAQTQRSFENFKIGTEKIPAEMVTVFAYLKKAAALTNKELGVVDGDRADAIVQACDDILAGKLDGNFPLAVWMTGSGTQFNMNVNEVVANRAKQILQAQGKDLNVHPNDHVNHSQSSNDTFPTGLHMVGVLLIEQKLFPAMEALYQALRAKQEAFKDIVKIGRTHLQDATPLTLGQEVSGWAAMMASSGTQLKQDGYTGKWLCLDCRNEFLDVDARMVVVDAAAAIRDKGFLTIQEPAAGAGGSTARSSMRKLSGSVTAGISPRVCGSVMQPVSAAATAVSGDTR